MTKVRPILEGPDTRFIQALNGKRRSLPGVPLVDRIAEELRPLGPQFLGDAWAKAVLPSAQEGLKRRRALALPIAWKHLVRGAIDQVHCHALP